MNELEVLALYLIGANMVAFILMGIDKRKAKRQQWRIPERTFWSLAIMGNALGVIVGMKVFRHKTKHRSFVFGMPMILVIQIILLITYFSLS